MGLKHFDFLDLLDDYLDYDYLPAYCGCGFSSDAICVPGNPRSYEEAYGQLRREHARHYPDCERILNSFLFHLFMDEEMYHEEASFRHEEMIYYIYGSASGVTTDAEYRSYMEHIKRCKRCKEAYELVRRIVKYEEFLPSLGIYPEERSDIFAWEKGEEARQEHFDRLLSDRPERFLSRNRHKRGVLNPQQYGF